ncbi:transposase [Bacillus sp. 1P02SD]|uniref:transposase n=1 Tax=Bacillus sp. 1P02SD TaxID=3132264 RepID=UPI0039A19148
MYIEILAFVHSMYHFTLHSYCWRTNHIHLQIQTTNFHIKLIMKEMHSRYAIYFNKKYHYDGHVFQARYGAVTIDTDQYLLEVSRNIHRNLHEAKMIKKLSSYE